jgi:ABC-2 type transport system ATP-binding protein
MRDESQAILRVRDVTKSYRDVPVLRGISFELYAGELLALLGPNGAGKTTLIRCLSGRSVVDSGEFDFGPPGGERRLPGIVPQSLAIYDDLTAQQNLRIFGRLHGIRGKQLRTRVREALEWSNLEERRHSLAKTFSGGMKRRLNIACSVLHQPQLLLLDEPTVGVDPQSRERIYEMLAQLRQAGTGILLTTHHLEEAEQRCDRVAIIDHGEIVGLGTFQELVESTVGHGQRLTVDLQQAPPTPPEDFSSDDSGKRLLRELHDVAEELPRVMGRLHAVGVPVKHVTLRGPTLQDVFLHLAGRELRE